MKKQFSWKEWFETHMNTEMQPEEVVMSKESLDLLSVPISFQDSTEKANEAETTIAKSPEEIMGVLFAEEDQKIDYDKQVVHVTQEERDKSTDEMMPGKIT